MRAYSERQFSSPHDELPAVAALEEGYLRTQPVTRHLAGLWEEDLLLQCLWSSLGNARCSRPPAYRTPSWSWASAGSLMYLDRPEGVEYALMLLEAETTLRAEGDPLGEATCGPIAGGVVSDERMNVFRRVGKITFGREIIIGGKNVRDSPSLRAEAKKGDRAQRGTIGFTSMADG